MKAVGSAWPSCGHFGPPSVLINNAGVGAWGEITELAEADWDRADADVPAEKMILPDDIAATVLYLLNLSPNVAIREIVMEPTTSLNWGQLTYFRVFQFW